MGRRPTKCKMKSLQIKSQAPKWTWKKKNMQAVVKKRATQKGRCKYADLRGQVKKDPKEDNADIP